jgi:hypothetical protein
MNAKFSSLIYHCIPSSVSSGESSDEKYKMLDWLKRNGMLKNGLVVSSRSQNHNRFDKESNVVGCSPWQ